MTNLMRLFMQISVTASAMILVVMAMRALLSKRMSPVVVMMLWAVVLVRLCIPVMLESPVNIGRIIPEQPVQQVSEASETSSVLPKLPALQGPASVPETNVYGEIIQQPERYETTQGEPEATVSWSLSSFVDRIPWWSILTAVWIVGAAIVLCATARHYIMFRRRLKKCVQTTDDTLIRIVNQYKRELRVNKKVKVIECSDIKTPAVFGYYNPTILLPTEFIRNMDDYAVRCILLHEMCHIKRRDILKSYAWLVAKALHWFNPLVWIAYKMFKDDTELCCDQMVLSKLNEKRKYEYTQSLIDVFRMSRQTEALSLTISLFETKTKLVERVMRMLKPERKSKAAAWVSFMLAAVMIVACFTTSCMPVKETDETIDAALAEIQNEDADEKETEDLQQIPEQNYQLEDVQAEEIVVEEKEPLARYRVTGKWTDTMEREDSIIKLNINADIVMPDVDTYNTYYVNPAGYISQEMLSKMIELLFGDEALYEWQRPTKGELQEQLDGLQIIYQSMLDDTYDFSHCSSKENIIESIEGRIEWLEEDIEEAPETIEPVPLNTITLVPNEYDGVSFRGVADLGREEKAKIIVSQVDDITEVRFINEGYYWDKERQPCQSPIGNLTITEDEAIKTANVFLEGVGLNDFQLVNNYVAQRIIRYIPETGQFAHVLEYTRVVDGMEVSQNYYIPHLEPHNCYNERMVFSIDDDGIREIDWNHGFALGQAATQDQQLLPLDEAKAIIMDKMYIHEPILRRMSDEDMNIPGFEMQECTYNIDQIRLEYMKIPFNNDVKDIRLIPVWSVYATEDWRFTKKENGERVEDVRNKDDSYVHLTINALDGSMVDKELWAIGKFY